MFLDNLNFFKSLTLFVFSVNFMFFCSHCATLGKIGGSLGDVGCKTDGDCVANADCINNGFCMCNRDYVHDMASQICLPKSKKINDTCKIDLQCSSSFGTWAFCNKNSSSEVGECRCSRNTHFQDGLCYESVRLGDACKVSDNCVSVSNIATYCASSVCVCADRHHPSDDRRDCIPDVDLGKKCTRDEECVAGHSYCSGVCYCQTGYIISADKTACLPAAKQLREQCSEDSQCQKFLPNTFCDSQENNCKCVPFSHELDKNCWISAKLGEPCTHPNQCTTPSMNRSVVACSQGACSCITGYTRAHSDCVKVKDAKGDSSTLEKFIFLIVAAVLLTLPNDI